MCKLLTSEMVPFCKACHISESRESILSGLPLVTGAHDHVSQSAGLRHRSPPVAESA